MGVKDGFMGASVMLKVALILVVISNLCNWIAFTTTSWGYRSVQGVGVGVWRVCNFLSACSDRDGYRADWVAAFQAFAIFGYVGINVAMLFIILYLFVGACKGNGEIKMATIVICFITAVCYLIAVIVYAEYGETELFPISTKGEFKLGFSFGLAIVAFLLEIGTGVLLVLDGIVSGGTGPV